MSDSIVGIRELQPGKVVLGDTHCSFARRSMIHVICVRSIWLLEAERDASCWSSKGDAQDLLA